jgi:hypothetical protein
MRGELMYFREEAARDLMAVQESITSKGGDDAATMAAPLTDLLKKGINWEWGPSQDDALRKLKEAATLAQCLAGELDPTLPVYFATDASLIGVAAVIFQLFQNDSTEFRRTEYKEPWFAP